MGAALSKLRQPLQRSPSFQQRQRQQQQRISYLNSTGSPYRNWQQSNKNIDDLIVYLYSKENNDNEQTNNTEQSQEILDRKIYEESRLNKQGSMGKRRIIMNRQNKQQISVFEQQKYQNISTYLTTISNKQKLYNYLSSLQQSLLNINTNNINNNNIISSNLRSKLIRLVHNKLANLWFVWGAITSHTTVSVVHQQMLPAVSSSSWQHKLDQLYWVTQKMMSSPAMPITNININNNQSNDTTLSAQTLVKQAIRTNYPHLITQQTISHLFTQIIDNQIVIQDRTHFGMFMRVIVQQLAVQGNVRSNIQYVERLTAVMGQGQQQRMRQYSGINSNIKQYIQKYNTNTQQSYIIQLILQCGYNTFLIQYGTPQPQQLLFQSILSLLQYPQIYLTHSQLKLYLYTQIYALFTYNLLQFNLQFKHLYNMSVSNIVHLMLRKESIAVLELLYNIYGKVNQIAQRTKNRINKNKDNKGQVQQQTVLQLDFTKQLSKYIFSSYCPLQTCLQLIQNNHYFPKNNPTTSSLSSLLIHKLAQSKFQLIIQNQTLIKHAIETYCSNNTKYDNLRNKVQQILEIVRLFYMFGVNQKFSTILAFYFNNNGKQSLRSSNRQSLQIQQKLDQQLQQQQIQNEQQQKQQQFEDSGLSGQDRALYLIKNLVSKFYISADRSRKIMLNSKSSAPVAVDLSKSQAIFQITSYLYDKLFKPYLNSVNDIHQLIFQHMIYFYRYQQSKSLLSSPQILQKYSIQIQTLQSIITNNIIQSIQKTSPSQLNKIVPDLNQQLKLLKNSDKNNVQIQGVRAMVKLVSQLVQNGMEIAGIGGQRGKIGIGLLEEILEKYPDRIEVVNFDNIYQHIRAINANQIIDAQQKFLMTNQLLKFKCKLASKAFQTGKKSLGNTLIDEISNFNPPWLTSELIKIFQACPTYKFDKRIYGLALKACSKGKDLQFLMKLWKQQQGKQRRKQKGFAQFKQYFETGRQYLIIDDSFIKNQQQYRNYVAQSQFNDQDLHSKKYQLFFALLGSQPQRAFHYAIKVELDPFKVETFLKQAMKNNIINCYTCVELLFKYFHIIWRIQSEKLKPVQIPVYSQYLKFKFNQEQQQNNLNKLKKLPQKSLITEYYIKVLSAYLSSLSINERFINTYFLNGENEAFKEKDNKSMIYQILFDEKRRKNLLIDLREQPMGHSDIITLNQVCEKVLGVNLLQLCLFSLANLSNTSQQLNQKCQNIMQKIITLSNTTRQLCLSILSKLTQKIFSINRLLQILNFLQTRQNPFYRQIISQMPRNILLLQSLSLVQTAQQFHGLIPSTFFNNQLKYDPHGPLSVQHDKIIRRCWSKKNIFVISKVVYFIYGMNQEVQRKIWEQYLKEHPEQQTELGGIRAKLNQVSKQV